MKVSLSWLNDYVTIEMGIDRLADELTMAGLEVETVSDRYAYLENVIVSRIDHIDPHPNADKLQLCILNAGDRSVNVVCGAPNVKTGMLVPLALPGSVLPDGSVLKESTIRGSASFGMICSEKELGFGTDAGGIMELDPSLTIGEKLAKALNLSDPVIEIDLTPNRPDCLSVIGIAREIAVIQKTKLKYPDFIISETGNEIKNFSSVTIDAPDLCPRYVARLLTDIKIKESPFWLQERLLSVGLRPINNIVDTTNFVLMETGQPLHAFDFDQLAQNKIIVRSARKGEIFTTLDNKERRLSKNMLMICDGEKPVAIGGVMGGLNSEIEDTTTRVLIESAYFNPMSIRKTSKKLGLNTEASHRFERGIDPDGTVSSINRAALLMAKLSEGKLVPGMIDEYPNKIPVKTISLSVNATNRLLGTVFKRNEIKNYLESIEFKVSKGDSESLRVTHPSFRVDITRPQDLMEEVARLSGYNNIPTTFPAMPAEAVTPLKPLETRNRIKQKMVGFGFSETITYSFIHPSACDHLRLNENDPRRKIVKILNPLTDDQAVMRTSLVPGLLETMHRNISRQEINIKLFEIGRIYFNTGNDNQPDESEILAGLWSGSRFPASWHQKGIDCDFFDLKGVVEELFSSLKMKDLEFTGLPDKSFTYTKPGFSSGIYSKGEYLGMMGEVHPGVLENFNLKQSAYIFELDMDKLQTLLPDIVQFNPVPIYPSVPRDITIIIDKNIESRTILKNVETAGEEWIEKLYIFDIYDGDPIPSGKRSISFRIIYRSTERTLEDEEVNRVHKIITTRLLKKFKADLPA